MWYGAGVTNFREAARKLVNYKEFATNLNTTSHLKFAGGYDCAGQISPKVDPFLPILMKPKCCISPENLGAVPPSGSKTTTRKCVTT